jgi:hypothetical protein
MRRIELHDVPKDRLAADLDEGFRENLGLFADACSKATGQNHDLHAASCPGLDDRRGLTLYEAKSRQAEPYSRPSFKRREFFGCRGAMGAGLFYGCPTLGL